MEMVDFPNETNINAYNETMKFQDYGKEKVGLGPFSSKAFTGFPSCLPVFLSPHSSISEDFGVFCIL